MKFEDGIVRLLLAGIVSLFCSKWAKPVNVASLAEERKS
jgi:hypothetical protein